MSKPYRAIIYHPGPRSLWRTGRPAQALGRVPFDQIPIVVDGREPDQSEIIKERLFSTAVMARAWAFVYLGRLTNVNAEIHVSAIDS